MAKKLSDLIGQFATIPNSFIQEAKTLSTEAKWLFVILRYHTNSKTGNAFPSYTKINEITGFHRKTISKALKELEGTGWLTKQRRFGASTLYALQIPSSSISDTTEPQTSSATGGTVSSITSATISSSDGVHANQTEEETRSSKPDKELSPHARLMKIHSDRLGGNLPDPQAQAGAVKWIVERFPMEKAVECYQSQLGESWRKGHVSWLTVKQRIAEFAKPMPYVPLEKIVADHGDWYEVEACQGGGTSPRYRTAEAFARLTGRDLETVRLGWN